MSTNTSMYLSRRVLLVSSSTWNLNNFRRPLIERLHRNGVTVFTAAPPPSTPEAWAFPTRFFPLTHLQPTAKNPLTDARVLYELTRLLRRIRPDLILSFTVKPNCYVSLVATQLGISYIPTVTGLGSTFIRDGWTQRGLRLLYRIAFRRSAAVVFHNSDDARMAVEHNIVPAGLVQVIRGSGIDLQRFSFSPLPARTGPLRVLFIGRLLRDKGICELVQAISRLHAAGVDITLDVVGDRQTGNPSRITDDEWTQLRNVPGITWHGFQKDVRPYLQAAHLYALPSYREGLPMSNLEAMATGRPLLTTDVPGCRETVEVSKNGWLVAAQSAAALESALLTAERAPHSLLVAYGAYGRSLAEQHFSAPRVAAAYAGLWRSLLVSP